LFLYSLYLLHKVETVTAGRSHTERRKKIFYCIHEAAFGEEGIAPGFLVRQSYNELFFLCFLKKNSSFFYFTIQASIRSSCLLFKVGCFIHQQGRIIVIRYSIKSQPLTSTLQKHRVTGNDMSLWRKLH
jgi:deoxycytidylate deaminase